MGYDVVSANNICQTFYNVFGVAFMAVGASIAIILGQLLGADKLQEAKESSRKLIAFSVFISVLVGGVFFICATFIPNFYNVSDTVRQIATYLMIICAVTMPMDALFHSCYFTLRSGGKIYITLIFDSGFIWFVTLPIAFILSRYTALSVMYVYGICQAVNIIKCIFGSVLVNKGVWLKNIVENA
jgi:Na+-driven multidrug efflux pump